MNILKSIILGILQGLTEFLPVSSSGHLVLAEHYLDFHMPGSVSFEVFLHLGSVIAVLIYFRKDIYALLESLIKFRNKDTAHIQNRNTIFFLLISTIVTGVIYYFFKDSIEKIFDASNSRNLYIVSLLLGVTGLIVFLSDKIQVKMLKTHNLGIKKSIIIGTGQAFALLPGISRMGTTISLGIFTGMKRDHAARYSFLLSIPAILGAAIFKLKELVNLELDHITVYVAGAVAAFISGYLVISLLISMVKKQKLKYFAFYCWAVSIVTITMLTLK